MYRQTIQLGQNELLQFDWGKNYRDFTLHLNGQLLGSIPDKAALKMGQSFLLPGNRQITVILSNQGLEAWQNGVDLLSGLPSGFIDHFNNSTNYLIGFGILQIILGGVVLAMLSTDPFIAGANFAGIAILGGGLIALGIWAKLSGSTTPLVIAIILLAVNIVLTLAMGKVAGILLSGIVIYQLYKGIRAGAYMKHVVRQPDPDGPLDAGL